MKRDISLLTKADIQRIEWWLGELPERCPFPYHGHGCSLCASIFPKLNERDCPCYQYPLKYVRRVARQVIREWREKNG